MTNEMNLTEFGKSKGWDDDQLIAWAKENLGMDEEDIRLMLAIERGETDSDTIQENE